MNEPSLGVDSASPDHSGGGAPLGAIGAGNMGAAIIRGSIQPPRRPPGEPGDDRGPAGARVRLPAEWVAADPDSDKRDALAALGVPAVATIAELNERLADDALVLLAVKPQMLPDLAADLARLLVGTRRSVLSILAGSTVAGIERVVCQAAAAGADLTDWTGGVLRSMPNTPAAVGRGVSALATPAPTPGGRSPSPEQADAARDLFRSLGSLHELDEGLIDAFTAIAGSGPAYVFRFAEAMTEAGKSLGLPADEATDIAVGTVVGAAALLECDAADRQGSADPAALRHAVTSKGGTTAAALAVLEEAGLGDIVNRAAAAARDRGRELAEG